MGACNTCLHSYLCMFPCIASCSIRYYLLHILTMNIIPIHFDKSLPVSNWQAIIDDATEMARIMDEKEMEYMDGRRHVGHCVALHHMQVCERPFNFFVLSNLVPEQAIKELESRFIINPKIESFMQDSVSMMKEGCVSFPYRKETKKARAYVVTVSYQVPDAKGKGGLRDVRKQVAGVVAQIFQHECDHAVGVNMYYPTPKK